MARTVLLSACGLITCIASFALLGGATMPTDAERLMLLKDAVAVQPSETPNFQRKGPLAFHPEEQKDKLILVQGLVRQIPNLPGKERTDIIIRLFVLPNREMGYEAALSSTTSQRIYPDGAGMPQGSWTGLPIGEKSWYSGVLPEGTKPAPGLGSAILVVWDDKLAMRVEVDYQPIGGPKAKTAIFLPIAKEDLELGEWAARLILAKAHLVLLGWRELPTVRLVANGKALEGKRTKEGAVFVPVQALLKELGGKVERKLGVIWASWGGKKVTTPIGARVLLVGKGKVALDLPVLWDGREGWVEAKGIAKALGLALRWEKGQMVLGKQ